MRTESKFQVIFSEEFSKNEHCNLYPFDRFVLDVIEATNDYLNDGVISKVIINASYSKPFGFNYGVRKLREDELEIFTNVYSPMMLMYLIHDISEVFLNPDTFSACVNNSDVFVGKITDFTSKYLGTNHSSEPTSYIEWIECLNKDFHLNDSNFIGDTSNMYDYCCKYIVYHEVAHYHMKQLELLDNLTLKDIYSYEVMADLVAAEWMFNNTLRGLDIEDGQEFISTVQHRFHRMMIGLNINMLFQAIGQGLSSSGVVLLEGSASHPNAFVRRFLQKVYIETLALHYYKEIFTDTYLREHDNWSNLINLLLYESGIFRKSDSNAIIDLVSDLEVIVESLKVHDCGKYGSALQFLNKVMESNLADILLRVL